MGHYLSEMSGPPFDFEMGVDLDGIETQAVYKEIKKESKVFDKDSVRVKIGTITYDKKRKWFTVYYKILSEVKRSSMYGGNMRTLNPEIVDKIFSKRRLESINRMLEAERKRMLK